MANRIHPTKKGIDMDNKCASNGGGTSQHEEDAQCWTQNMKVHALNYFLSGMNPKSLPAGPNKELYEQAS